MTTGSPNHDSFLSEIKEFVPADRIYTDALRRLAWGTDASFYRLIPKIVIISKDEEEVSRILHCASQYGVDITFRGAGTSLSGQSITDSILLVATKNWEKYSISPDAATITMQPGLNGGRINEILQPYGKIFAPDPASRKSATVGGIIVNNASGMNCGTHANSDHILQSVRIVLADGSILDTSDEESKAAFEITHADLIAEIRDIKKLILADPELFRRIRHKYSIKNVTGLNLLPFVTYDDPFDIIAHCIVGSEGTLAFLSSATVKTSHLYSFTASAMLYFSSLEEACKCVVALKKNAPVHSCEMLDTKSLEAVNDPTGTGLTALLLDTKADTQQQLDSNISEIMEVVNQFDLYKEAHFSSDPEETGKWWTLRSGVFPAVGGTRPSGTTALIEDIAFYINDLPKATAELVHILKESGYEDACIYGHALEGNYHFIISQAFNTPEDIDKYRNLMIAIEHLVVDRYDGSLKAEHGVGRNMAPFVEREWGARAWAIMRRIKDAFDPQGILNRGVIFNDDPDCFIRNLKPLESTHPIIDKCIECGFCEPNCVSCGFALSARQRNVVVREISRLTKSGSPEDLRMARLLKKQFHKPGDKYCAGDGLCSMSCPMGINTGEMVHAIREQYAPKGSMTYSVGKFAANHLNGISKSLRLALSCTKAIQRGIGDEAVDKLGSAMHKIGLPLWSAALPGPNPAKDLTPDVRNEDLKVVYFPSCINRTMGTSGKEKRPLVEVIRNLCAKAGYQVIFPEGMNDLCCGMIWESKGMPDIADEMTARLEEALLKASEGGRYPVLCDQSPCLHRMREHIKSMKLYEPAEFISTFLAPRLRFTRTDEPIAVHVTCSTRRMGLADCIIDLASKCSSAVTVPAEIGCCGFAGDKGFTLPELNTWALRKLRPALEASGAKFGYSNSRTCEIGLTRNGGIPYKSIAYLVDEHTEPLTQIP